MLAVYINYPRTRVSIHLDSSVEENQRHAKAGQRILVISISTLSDYLEKFKNREYRFEPNQEFNDMWIEVDFGSVIFERAVVDYIIALIAERYPKMGSITPEIHSAKTN